MQTLTVKHQSADLRVTAKLEGNSLHLWLGLDAGKRFFPVGSFSMNATDVPTESVERQRFFRMLLSGAKFPRACLGPRVDAICAALQKINQLIEADKEATA